MAKAKPLLARSIETWRRCDPESIAHRQSRVAIQFAFTDIRHDVLALADSNAELIAALEHAIRWFDQLKPEDIARYLAIIAKVTRGASHG